MTDRIGEFLVRIGAMQPYQVEDMHRAQQASDNRLFGEIAIDKVEAHCSPGNLDPHFSTLFGIDW